MNVDLVRITERMVKFLMLQFNQQFVSYYYINFKLYSLILCIIFIVQSSECATIELDQEDSSTITLTNGKPEFMTNLKCGATQYFKITGYYYSIISIPIPYIIYNE